jgi:glutamate synthase (NADPH/NADH) small chain
MPEQAVEQRIRNFNEVALGYTIDQALAEANRCLQCKQPPCVKGCPVEIDIPAFIKHIKNRELDKAIEKIKEKNALPGICGRVCPQEDQCEKHCVLSKKGEPIAIGRLERFAADYEQNKGAKSPNPPKLSGKKVAVIGSGPAGLTAAAELAKLGYDVTIFESLHQPGGVLMYGIPEFRLPKHIVQTEVDYVKKLGVKIQLDVVVGKTLTVDDLLNRGFECVFIGTGAGMPYFLDIPGENLNGVYSANEFLTRVNLMKAYKFPEYDTPVKIGKKVAVVGAGNVAMDSARTALRLGADEVFIVYRRSEAEMPARKEEIQRAKEEGIKFLLLTNPVELIGDKEGWVRRMKCIRMRLGEPDKSGRRRPVPIPNSEFYLEADLVVIAIGQGPNPLVPRTTKGLKTGEEGNIIVDPETGQTSREKVFAGGDIASGAATVIEAMGAGKKAARAIDKFLKSRN